MPTLLRFSLAGLLLLAFCMESVAQRTGRRRSGPKPQEFSLVKITRDAEQAPGKKVFDRIMMAQEFMTTEAPALSQNHSLEIPAPAAQGIEIGLGNEDDYILTEADDITARLDCRETNPINKIKTADAYPWISEDGLRLYFSSSNNVDVTKIYISTRNSVNDVFGAPQVLSSRLQEGFIGAAFTNDELTMCAVSGGKLYLSTRASRDAEFPAFKVLEGAANVYHLGPSFSPDGSELVVTVKISGKYSIRRYLRSGNYLKASDPINVPAGEEPGPGQLSKDGLSYYFTIKEKDGETIWRYSRPSTAEAFDKLEKVDNLGEWAKTLPNHLQPSINGDGSIIVFVTSAGRVWSDNEIGLINLAQPVEKKVDNNVDFESSGTPIYLNFPLIDWSLLTKNDTLAAVAEKKSVVTVNAYPNPFTSDFTIDISELPVAATTISIYNINGSMVKQQRIINKQSKVDLGKMSSGVYTFTVTTTAGELLSSGKLVKAN